MVAPLCFAFLRFASLSHPSYAKPRHGISKSSHSRSLEKRPTAQMSRSSKDLNVRIAQTFQGTVDRAHPRGSLSITRKGRVYPSELLTDRAW